MIYYTEITKTASTDTVTFQRPSWLEITVLLILLTISSSPDVLHKHKLCIKLHLMVTLLSCKQEHPIYHLAYTTRHTTMCISPCAYHPVHTTLCTPLCASHPVHTTSHIPSIIHHPTYHSR